MTGQRAGIALLITGAVFVVLGLGLAFTVYGEVALLLAAVSIATGAVLTSRKNRL